MCRDSSMHQTMGVYHLYNLLQYREVLLLRFHRMAIVYDFFAILKCLRY